jgi:hypothetical protein
MLAMGTSYSELERVFDIDRRSISNHDKNHLNIEDAAIRRIIEDEAIQARESMEDGIRGAVARRVYLESVVKKAQEALLNDETEIEIRDAIAAIEKLDKLDATTSEVQIEEMRTQFHAFMQAVKEIVEEELWDQIRHRTSALLEAKNATAIDTTAVEEDVKPLNSGA